MLPFPVTHFVYANQGSMVNAVDRKILIDTAATLSRRHFCRCLSSGHGTLCQPAIIVARIVAGTKAGFAKATRPPKNPAAIRAFLLRAIREMLSTNAAT